MTIHFRASPEMTFRRGELRAPRTSRLNQDGKRIRKARPAGKLWRVLFCCAVLELAAVSALAQKTSSSSDLSKDEQEKQTCTKNLMLIHKAIQAFRKDHKELPNWISDLVPQYVSDTNILICPVTARTGRKHSFEEFKDPRKNTSYIYQFCAGEALSSLDPVGQMSNADVKRLQMCLVGGGVPILTCVLHRGGLVHVNFDGQPFETRQDWEERYFDVVPSAELGSARRILEKFGKVFEKQLTEADRQKREAEEAKKNAETTPLPDQPKSWPWWAWALGGGGGFYFFVSGVVLLFSLGRRR